MNKNAQAYADAEENLQEHLAEQSLSDEIPLPDAEASNEELAEQAQIAKLQEALAYERELRMREAAEFENIKKRIERQNASDLEYANSKIIKDLLPVLDALEQASAFEADDEFSSSLKDGLNNINRLFEKVMSSYGVSKIAPNPGDAIDPEIHEVLLNQPNEALEPGTISLVMQTGYKLKERTIRAAKVAANN